MIELEILKPFRVVKYNRMKVRGVNAGKRSHTILTVALRLWPSLHALVHIMSTTR